MTTTQRTNLTAKNGNGYESVASVNITFDGKTSDGDYLDVQRSLDWLEAEMQAEVFIALAGSAKVPFTDEGVATIEAAVRSVVNRTVARGIFAASPAPTVTVPDVADVSAANKTARTLPDVKFDGTLAGAIHKTTVTGVVSV
jgi:hypothetical protein